jgi:hypothetical protein
MPRRVERPEPVDHIIAWLEHDSPLIDGANVSLR